MKKLLTTLFVLICCAAIANDGAFYSQGNQLIPINDSTISVQKEILTVKRVADTSSGWGSCIQVNVYYEFFNPGPAKDLIVGFEASGPDGHVSTDLDNSYAGHPYIYDFQVVMNGETIPYQLAHVPYKYKGDWQFDYNTSKEDYYKDGQVQDVSMSQYNAMIDSIFEGDDAEGYSDFYGWLFYYVYHFNAHFKEGLNIVQHTYSFKGSDLVMMDYVFDYVLTAANRWANNGIDDFTLIVDLGEMTTFFCGIEGVGADEWTFSGKGKKTDNGWHIQSGNLVLHKTNFHPEGELKVIKAGNDYMFLDEKGDVLQSLTERYVSLDADYANYIGQLDLTKEEKSILKNVPFAYRGYVFKKEYLQKYFEATDWYVPNPNYKPDMNLMSEVEMEWINYWSKK